MLNELTRRDVIDSLALNVISYIGHLEELDFSGRFYVMKAFRPSMVGSGGRAATSSGTGSMFPQVADLVLYPDEVNPR